MFDEVTEASEASRRLRTSGYDHAPTTRSGRIHGRVALDRLDTTVASIGEVAEPLGVGDFIAADARLRELLSALAAQPILFVLDGREISGIVTPSDLNKQAARAHFYVLVSAVEMGLSDALRSTYRRQDRALELLTPDRRERVKGRFERDRRSDVEADLIAEFELIDLFTAVIRTPDLSDRLASSRTALSRLGGSAVALRHDVMHPVRIFLGNHRTPGKVASLEDRLRNLIEALSRLPKRPSPASGPGRIGPRLGPTPEQLARELGVSGLKVRNYLRHRHTRPPALKWSRWGPLEPAVAADVRKYFSRDSPRGA